MKQNHPPPEVVVVSRTQAVRIPRKRIARLAAFLAREEGCAFTEVEVAVVDRSEMAELHWRYLHRRGETDVLSFDVSDPGAPESVQIVVCGPVAASQARRLGVGVQRELLLYVAHGLLHRMGYDDTDERSARRMQNRQEALLEAFRRSAAR